MKQLLHILFIIFLFHHCVLAQEEEERKVGNQIFLPSVEIGYVGYNSDNLTGGILVKTSIEYRFRNNNDLFLRVNYDNRDAVYRLESSDFTNVLEGSVRFTDFLGGIGYRFGDKDVRVFILAQAGITTYDFPNLEVNNNSLSVTNEKDNLFITRATLGIEYYLAERTAISIEFLQSQVWENEDFWDDKTGSWGVSFGVIAALF